MKIAVFVLSLLLAAVLTGIYMKISTPEVAYSVKKNNVLEHTVKESIKKPLVYSFPARILFMKIDFRNYKKVIIYKVVINLNDKFEFFNVKALLNNYNIPFTLFESGKILRIYILFRNFNEAKRILDLFKEYNFNIKIIKQIKRI